MCDRLRKITNHAFRVRAFRRVVVSSSRRDSAKRKRDPIAA
jgi:hypothetical protein